MSDELLPCGHYQENLILVDERAIDCPDCAAPINDDSWMCGVCFPQGALPCGHAIEMRSGETCIACEVDRLRAALRGFPDPERDVEELREALKRAADMLHAVIGDMEDGYSIDMVRGKYVLAVIEARDKARALLRRIQRVD